MERGRVLRISVLLTMFVLLTLWLPLDHFDVYLEDPQEKREQLGPGGPTIEEQCSTITFEDMFEYSKAIFHMTVDDDWNSAEIQAVAWVNGTLADDVRHSLDRYIAAIYPSGDDEWISTDEREGVRAIASECVQYTLTRIGMRDGSPHRGGEGTDWKNTSWTEDEVLVEEWNLVPPRHSESRECSSVGSSADCYEVPVYPNNERDCDADLDVSIGEDECRLMLWLNATMTISSMNNPSDFTIAFNASNISGAEYHITFPVTEGLRLDMWEECEGRDVQVDMGDFAGLAPLRGSCIGDGSSSHGVSENEDGSLTYSLYPNMAQWPLGEDLFADFTTAPIPVDEPPVWTDNAPADESWFPQANGGAHIVADWNDVQHWFDDEAGVSSLDVNCRGEADLAIRYSNRELSMDVPIDEAGEVTCEAIDSAGQSSGNRTWFVGVPFQISTTNIDLSDPHPITLSPTTGWPDLSVEIGFTSSYGMAGTYSGPFLLQDSEVTQEVTTVGIIPGSAYVAVIVTGDGVYGLQATYDLGIVKASSAPIMTVNSEGWDGDSWSMSGQFSDPDGEAVIFTLLIDGSSVGSISVSGNIWSTPQIDFSVWAEGTHIVEVRACDDSGICSSQQRSIDNTHLFVDPEPEPEPEPPKDNSSVLPSMGLGGLILAASAALIYSGRRD
ncbi:MAG: hypothetical protein VW551_05955 [Euryarchaeota archaeon]